MSYVPYPIPGESYQSYMTRLREYERQESFDRTMRALHEATTAVRIEVARLQVRLATRGL